MNAAGYIVKRGTSVAITNSNGTVGITKSGTGTMVIFDSNNYISPTTVSGGRLVISGKVNQSSSVRIATCAELEISGSLAVSGNFANSGTLRLIGDVTFSFGIYINAGVLDLINWTGTLPAGFVNQGVVLDRSSLKIASFARSGNDFTLTIQGHAAYNFQLQRTADLTSPWLNIGPAQPGTGAPFTFTDTGGAGPSTRFYRVAVSIPLGGKSFPQTAADQAARGDSCSAEIFRDNDFLSISDFRSLVSSNNVRHRYPKLSQKSMKFDDLSMEIPLHSWQLSALVTSARGQWNPLHRSCPIINSTENPSS